MRVLDVHLDLLSRLPVRTVEAKPLPERLREVHGDSRNSGRRSREDAERMYRRIQRMKAAGVEREHIAEALGVSMSCVDRRIGISTVAKATKRRK